MRDALEMWTVYDRPRDFPDKFVARRSLASANMITVTSDTFMADSLDELRAMLPDGLHRIPRYEQDDPVIVEVWL